MLKKPIVIELVNAKEYIEIIQHHMRRLVCILIH